MPSTFELIGLGIWAAVMLHLMILTMKAEGPPHELWQTFFWPKPGGDMLNVALGWTGWIALGIWPLAALMVAFGIFYSINPGELP